MYFFHSYYICGEHADTPPLTKVLSDQALAVQGTGNFRYFANRLKKRLTTARNENKPLYSKCSTSIFDQPVKLTSTGMRVMEVESLAFLLNPIICHVCCGNEAEYLYCGLPSREDFSCRGFEMDINDLTEEVRRLLTSGSVPITAQHLYRARGGMLEFSLEVMDALWSRFRPGTKVMLENFQIRRFRLSGSTGLFPGSLTLEAAASGRSGVEGELRLENLFLRAYLERAVANEAKAGEKYKASQAQLRMARRALSKSARLRAEVSKTLKECREKARNDLQMTLPDGSKAKAVLVDNIAFDPFQERPDEDKGKRVKFICFDWAILFIRGNLEPRPGTKADGTPIGGVRFTYSARLREALNTMRMGICPYSRAAAIRELSLHDQVVQMKIVPTDRTRRFPVQGRPNMRFLNYPSRRLLLRSILPAFQLQFFFYVVKLLYDPSTISVGVCGDGTHVRGFGVFGAVFSVYQRHKLQEDPLGNVLFVDTCRRFNRPLDRTANKFVNTMYDAHGNKFPPESWALHGQDYMGIERGHTLPFAPGYVCVGF
jgi:hypothetical protein